MRLILHLGAHKSGTSLVQQYMKANPLVMRQNRIGFVKRNLTTKYLAWATADILERRAAPLLAAIERNQRRNRSAFVISHENALGRPFVPGVPGLYPNALESALLLRDYFRRHRPEVIYYIRSQEQFIESYYLQTIHEGGFTPFSEWMESVDSERVSWAPVAAALRQAFGAENVIIRDFAREMSEGQAGYLQSFFRTILPGLDPRSFSNFDYREIRNPSIGDKGLAIALSANRHLENRAEKRLMRKFLQTNFSNRHYPRPVLLDEATKLAIRERYAAGNASLISPPLPATVSRYPSWLGKLLRKQ